jgi:hypothetical protein
MSCSALPPYGPDSVRQPRKPTRPRAASILVTPASPAFSSPTSKPTLPTLTVVYTLLSDLKYAVSAGSEPATEHALDVLEYQLSAFLDMHVATLSRALAAGMPMARVIPMPRPRETLLGLVHDLRCRLECSDDAGLQDDVGDLEGYIRWMDETHAVAETWVAAPRTALVEVNSW